MFEAEDKKMGREQAKARDSSRLASRGCVTGRVRERGRERKSKADKTGRSLHGVIKKYLFYFAIFPINKC